MGEKAEVLYDLFALLALSAFDPLRFCCGAEASKEIFKSCFFTDSHHLRRREPLDVERPFHVSGQIRPGHTRSLTDVTHGLQWVETTARSGRVAELLSGQPV